MAKRVNRTRQARRVESKGPNWLLIGGIVVVGVVALFALLFLTLQEQDSPQLTAAVEGQPLAEYCQENPGNCVAKGSDDAPVTIVEVSDYGCTHCKNFNLETAGLLEDLYVTPGQVKWVVMPYALGAQTAPAASAALCAAEQDGFFQYHRLLFESQGEPDFMTAAGFRQVAEDAGLDVEAFNACLQNSNYNNTVQENIRAATAIGVNSTPTFFINGTMMRGNQPLTAFQEQINAIIGGNDEG
jgi:protein-disulfide isomerase